MDVATSAGVPPRAWIPLGFGPSAQTLPTSRAATIKRIEFGAIKARHVGLDRVADPGLQIGEVTVAFRNPRQQVLVEFEPRRRIHGIEPRPFHKSAGAAPTPPAIALLKKIVELAGVDHVANHTLNGRPLRYGHLGLGDRPRARQIDRHAAEEVQVAPRARSPPRSPG